jgi:predicted RND superfamily exporter protein
MSASPNRFASAYADFMMKIRWPLLVVLLGITVFFALQIPNVDIRNDPDTLLPETNRYVATNAYGEQKYGMGNLMVFGLEVLEGEDIYQPWFINMVQELHQKVEGLATSRGKNFLDIAAQKVKYMGSTEDGGLQFKRLIPTGGISTTDSAQAAKELAFLKEGVEDNPVMAPMLIYKKHPETGRKCMIGEADWAECQAKAAFIIADYSDDVKEIYLPWVAEVEQIVNDLAADPRFAGKVNVLVAGEPYFLAYMLLDLVNKWWLFVISILIVVAVLWKENKSWRGAAFPLLGVFITIIWTLGLMGLSQYKLTTMMVLTPMLLLAIGTGHAVQVTRRFMQELVFCKGDDKRSAKSAIEHTIVPATLSIVTDAAGFFMLQFVDISFYKAYAYFGMFGMFTLLITTTTLIPLLMVMFGPKEHKLQECGTAPWEEGIGRNVTKMLIGPAKWLPVIFVVVIIGVSAQLSELPRGVASYFASEEAAAADPEIARIQQEADFMPGVEKGINYSRAAFKEHSKPVQQITRLGEIMPGVISVNIPIRGKTLNRPECIPDANGKLMPEGCWDSDTEPAQGIFNRAAPMKAIEELEDWMRAHPYIGFTGSYVQYLKIANMLLAKDPSKKTDLSLFHIPDPAFIKSRMDIYGDPYDKEYNPATDENANFMMANYNGLLDASTTPGDLDSFVDSMTWNEGVVMGFVNTMDPVKTHKVVLDIQNYLDSRKNDPGFSEMIFGFKNGDVITMPETGKTITVSGDVADDAVAVGGFLGATEATREVAIDQWLQSPLTTALAIFLIAALMFRSLMASGILIIMLLVTLFAQYGLGAYFTMVENWSGNLAFHLLVTLSIAMGLGVDYGIYMLSRLKEEMQGTHGDWWQSLRNTLSTTGSAVIVSVVVLLGSFIPLISTHLANTWGLGIFIGEALIIDVITALTLLPLLVLWFKPRYVYSGEWKTAK